MVLFQISYDRCLIFPMNYTAKGSQADISFLVERQRRRLHSTNMLERLMREIKRRTRVVGIFPNEASCDRLVGAMLIEYHETWQTQRARFIRMEEC